MRFFKTSIKNNESIQNLLKIIICDLKEFSNNENIKKYSQINNDTKLNLDNKLTENNCCI